MDAFRRETLQAGVLAFLGLSFTAWALIRPPLLNLTVNHQEKPSRLSMGEAEALLASARARLTANPEDIDAFVEQTVAFFSKGPSHYADGLNALERARSLGATGVSLFYYAGVMYEGLGLADYAIHELEQFLRNFPNDYETLVRLGNLQTRQENWPAAKTYYEQALKQNSGDATLWFNLAVSRKGMGLPEEALEAFSRAEKLARTLPEGGNLQIGEIWQQRGDLNQAKAFYEKEIESYPSSLPGHKAMESLARQNKDWKAAREWRKRIEIIKQESPA